MATVRCTASTCEFPSRDLATTQGLVGADFLRRSRFEKSSIQLDLFHFQKKGQCAIRRAS